MVVLGGGFFAPILAVEHPLEKFSKPILQAALVFAGQSPGAFKQTDRINHARQSPRLDQADAATCVYSGNKLRVLKVRIHPSRRIEKERAQ